MNIKNMHNSSNITEWKYQNDARKVDLMKPYWNVGYNATLSGLSAIKNIGIIIRHKLLSQRL